ncbi:Ubiquitin carboxyl-terminal hydrolase 24, partial [Cymbomonas tetramitiformis]
MNPAETPCDDESEDTSSEDNSNEQGYSDSEEMITVADFPHGNNDLCMTPSHIVDDLEAFPIGEFNTLMEGLHKSPSWTVYPLQLATCLSATARIITAGHDVDSEEIRCLLREAVPSAFEKCLNDHNLWRWNEDIQLNILEAVSKLMDLIVVKLQAPSDPATLEEDGLPLLRALTLAFDKNSQYHQKHKGNPLPLNKIEGEVFASSSPRSDFRPKLSDSDHIPVSERFPWLSYILNYFGQRSGFDLLQQALRGPEAFSLATLEALTLLLCKVLDILLPATLQQLQEPCEALLEFMTDLLENKFERLSDKNRDTSYSALSQMLRHIFVLYAGIVGTVEAQRVVSSVQRVLITRMRSYEAFNMQLASIREINAMLDNACALPDGHGSIAVRAANDWLDGQSILSHVMRRHLHQKQYVDQVQRALHFLLEEGCLKDDYLELIWSQAQKRDTHEALKQNIFNMLADLARYFSSEQLDSLFNRFEHSMAASREDTPKILELAKKLAHSDKEGVMATRLLELLWRMSNSRETPREVIDSGALKETLAHYASVQHASKEDFIARCIRNLQAGASVLPAVKLLQDIVELDP